MTFDKTGGVTESVMPSYFIKEQYLAEYFELISYFRVCSGRKMMGLDSAHVESLKSYRAWLAAIVSLGEKLRKKMEDKNSKRTKDKNKLYTEFLDNLNKLFEGEIIPYSQAVLCTKKISDFFEDAGYTKLEIPKIMPGRAVDEWD